MRSTALQDLAIQVLEERVQAYWTDKQQISKF